MFELLTLKNCIFIKTKYAILAFEKYGGLSCFCLKII